MRKRVFLFITLLLLTLSITSHAASMAYVANPSLSFRGTTAYCSVVCQGSKPTDSISAQALSVCRYPETAEWSAE